MPIIILEVPISRNLIKARLRREHTFWAVDLTHFPSASVRYWREKCTLALYIKWYNIHSLDIFNTWSSTLRTQFEFIWDLETVYSLACAHIEAVPHQDMMATAILTRVRLYIYRACYNPFLYIDIRENDKHPKHPQEQYWIRHDNVLRYLGPARDIVLYRSITSPEHKLCLKHVLTKMSRAIVSSISF